MIDAVISQAIKLDEVCTHCSDRKSIFSRFASDDVEHRLTQVDCKTGETIRCQIDEGPTGTAAEIRNDGMSPRRWRR